MPDIINVMTTYNRANGGAAALAFARQLTGLEYLYGGTAPGPTDCSGLVEWAYRQVGVALPRTTFYQYLEFQIPKEMPSQVGDLFFIAGSDAIGAKPGHVMMYVAPGEVFQAPQTGMKIGQYPYDTNVFEYRTRPALALPNAPVPPAPSFDLPTTAQLAQAGLTHLTDHNQAVLAINNGWPLYYFAGGHFVKVHPNLPFGTPEYANINYAHKRA